MQFRREVIVKEFHSWWQSPWTFIKITQFAVGILAVASIGMTVWFGSQAIYLRWQTQHIQSQYREQVEDLQKTVKEYTDARQQFTDTTPEDASSARFLFRALKGLYASPQAVEISESSIPLHGTAFFQYDPNLKRSFLFARIENLVKLPEKIPVIWLAKPGKENGSQIAIPLGVPEVRVESNQPTAYFVYTGDGDFHKDFSKLIISYEEVKTTQVPLQPSTVILEASW
jgi:hypothetical protein